MDITVFLNQTKRQSDNTVEKVFTVNPRDPEGRLTYNCQLCGVSMLPSEQSLVIHMKGRKHQQRMQPSYVPDVKAFRKRLTPKALQTQRK